MGCSLALLAKQPKLRLPEESSWVKGGGGVARLVGPAITKNLLYARRRVAAGEGNRMGFTEEVVPAERTLERAMELAGEASRRDPPFHCTRHDFGIRQKAAEPPPPNTRLALERSHFLALFGTEDRAIGMSWFP